jgi:hypothetical protein
VPAVGEILAVKLVVVPERVGVTPGAPISLTARITNDAPYPALYRLRMVGLDRRWWQGPDSVGPIEPAAAVDVGFQVVLPLGFPAGDHTVAVEAAPAVLRGGPQRPPSPQRGVVVLVVGAASELSLQLEPPHVIGRGKKSLGAAVHNKNGEPVSVGLRGEAPDGDVSFGFNPPRLTLGPGERAVVPVELRGRRPGFGDPRLRPFTVTAQSTGEPVQAPGSFTQRPWVPISLTKALAMLAVLALWATAMIVGLRRLTADEEEPATAADVAAIEAEAGAGGEGGGESGGGAGEGGAGEPEGDEAGAGGGGQSSTEVGGLIQNDEPEGVLVLIRPVSLVEDLTGQPEQANAVRQLRRASIFKLLGPLVTQESPQVRLETMTMTTTEDGEWGFAGVPAPGFYEVRFAKPGYGTASRIVTLTEDAKPVTLDVTLEPGDGSLGGLVTADGAPLGGVDVSITDGTVTYTTRTPTSGDVGRWSVGGIGTPATYLATFTRRGFGTETALIELPAGGSDTVNVAMRPGLGSVTGTVLGPLGEPLGGLKVTATDGTITRTTSTLTEGAVGSYIIPQLEVPGIYTISVEGEGWLTQTRSVTLDADAAANATGVDFVMVPTTATVIGTVTGQPGGVGLDSVGISASNGTTTFKTTSAANGDYELAGLDPGTYVITFERFGFFPELVVLTLVAGDVVEFDPPSLTVRPQNPPESNTVLAGVISDSVSNLPVTERVDVTVHDALCTSSTGAVAPCVTTTAPGNNGTYRFEGLPAGAYTIEFRAVRGYEAFSTTIRLPAAGTENLDVSLVPWGTVRGTVTGALVAGAPPTALGGVVVTAPNTNCAIPPLTVTCTATTSTDDPVGEYELLRAFPTGTYTLNFARPGFSGSVGFNIASGQELNISPQLTRAPEIVGTVYNRNPRAVPPVFVSGATVTIDPVDPTAATVTATTGTAGQFSAWVCNADDEAVAPADGVQSCLSPGVHTVTVSATGFASETTTVFVGNNQAVRVDVALFPTPVFTTGRVVWVDGTVDAPVANVPIQVEAVVDVRWIGFDFVFDTRSFTTTTDANGCFRIPMDPTNTDRPILYLQPATVNGGSVDPRFFPRTDVVLQPVEGGGPGDITPLDCDPTTANRVVLVARPGNIQAIVGTDPPVFGGLAGLTVTATNGVETRNGVVVPFFQFAFVLFTSLPAGTWDLRFDAGTGYEPVIAEVVVSPGATATPAVTLRDRSNLTIDVRDSVTGAGIGDANVTIDQPDFTVTVNGGAATAGLDTGAYVVTASGGGDAEIVLDPGGFTIDADGTSVETVPFRGDYRFTVTDDDGDAFTGTLTFNRQFGAPQSVGDDEVFNGLLPGSYVVDVTRTNYEPTQVAVTITPGTDPIVLVPLVPFAQLTVAVTNAAGGNQQGATVTVTLQPPGSAPPVTMQTGGNGQAVFNLRAGTYQVAVSVAAGSAPTATITLSAGQQLTHPVALVNQVTGTVTAAAGGAPIEGATVVATLGTTTPGRATTDASGVYTIGGLGIGNHTVTASATGFVTPAGQAANFTTFGNTLTLNFSLTAEPPPPPPGGTVTSASGEPLAGVAITGTNLAGETMTTTSAADGTWSLSGASGRSTWRITYFAEGYNPVTALIATYGPGGGVRDVALAGKGSFLAGSTFGRAATDADPGVPLDGVTVTLLDASRQVLATQAVRPVAGGFGYGFVDLDPGSYTVRFERAGYQTLDVPVELEERSDALVDATLAALNGRLTVLIRGPTGAPVGGAEVRLLSPARLPGGRSAVTGPDGIAVFDELVPADDYAVEADASPRFGTAAAGPVSIAPGQSDAAVTLNLTAPAAITGTVLVQASAASPPVPTDGVRVLLFTEDGNRLVGESASGATGAPGGYRFDGVEPGAYRLEFEMTGHEPVTRAGLSVASGGTATVDVTVRRLARLIVDVIGGTGAPVGGAAVSVAGRTLTTTPAGVAVFDDLPLGPATVQVGGASTDVVLQPGEQRVGLIT